MTERITIRKLVEEDLPQITNIQRTIIKKQVSRAWSQSIEAHFEKTGIVGFVAVENNNVIGYILGEIREFSFGIERSGWIEGVSVIPQYMGTGIGKKLAIKIFEYFKKMGILNIYTAVKWDAGDMLSFFKSIGFDRSEFINLGKHL